VVPIDERLAIQQDQIEHYGGSSGPRDPGLLDAAVEMPQASFGRTLLHADLFEMAAAYFFHIVQDHPFVDDNNRAGPLPLAPVDVVVAEEAEGRCRNAYERGKWLTTASTSRITLTRTPRLRSLGLAHS
jgi:hypothetical protein